MPEILISHKDDRNRKTLFPILKEMLAKDRQANPLLSVGRLDYMSEGILLITNSGELARHMELPESGYSRKYQVRIHGSVTDQKIKAIRHGVKIDGVLYDGMEFSLLRSNQANHIVSVTLKEGKNREVRNIFAFFNWQVSKLKRVQYGPYHLQDIPKGGLLEVPLKGKLKEWYHQTRQLLVQEELYHDHYYATHPYPVVADFSRNNKSAPS